MQPGAGETTLLSKRLSGAFDPVLLYAALRGDGGAAPMLFRRTGGRALILIDSALRLEATGSNATIRTLSETGKILLPTVAARLADHVESESEGHISLRFNPCVDPDEEARAAAPSALDALRAMTGIASRDGDEPFALTTLGIIGFDHVDMVEALPPRPAGDFPDLIFDLAETMLVIEPGGAARILSIAAGSDDPAIRHRQHHLAADRLAAVSRRCEQAVAATPPTPPVAATATPDLDEAAFMNVVDRLKAHVAAGDIFQAVPSRAFRAPCPDALAAFRRLVSADPSAYHFYADTGFGTLFGASPETALELRRDAQGVSVSVSPIAGTRPRGSNPDEDDRQEADLRLDAKEVAEHLMLVDLARNDVARVAQPGTRRVTSLLSVERFARVMHLVSTVEGKLAPGRDAIDAVRACLNVGTLSGAPKLKAIELIRMVEGSARGPYGGAIGYLTARGEMDSAVIIRSALVRVGEAEVRAGAGVVADSDPAAEAAETRAKASAVLAALGAAA